VGGPGLVGGLASLAGDLAHTGAAFGGLTEGSEPSGAAGFGLVHLPNATAEPELGQRESTNQDSPPLGTYPGHDLQSLHLCGSANP
jgi:hypothetical protein